MLVDVGEKLNTVTAVLITQAFVQEVYECDRTCSLAGLRGGGVVEVRRMVRS